MWSSKPSDSRSIYIDAFSERSEGLAIYEECSAAELKPGCCGYFDQYGDWHTIVQLSDPKATEEFDKEPPYCPPEGFLKDQHGIKTTWDVLETKDVTGTQTDAKVKTTVPNAPVSAGVGIEYTCNAEYGAVLVVNGRATKHEASVPAMLKDWVERNLVKIIHAGQGDLETIKKKGIWLVTKTYVSKQRAFYVMSSKGMKATFQAEVDVMGQIQATPSHSWWHERTTGTGWVKSQEESHGLVLFMGGVWWKPRWYCSSKFKAIRERSKQHLGAEEQRTEYIEHDNGTFIELLETSVSEAEDVAPDSDVDLLEAVNGVNLRTLTEEEEKEYEEED